MRRWYFFLLIGALIAPAAYAQKTTIEARKAQMPMLVQQTMQRHRALGTASVSPQDTYVLEASTFHIWEEDQWTPYTETDYTYDNGRLTEVVQTTSMMGIVTSRDQTLYTYDAGGRVATREYRYWDSEAEEFVPSDLEIHTYGSSSSLPTETISQVWDGAQEEYVNAERSTVDIEFSNGAIVLLEGQDYEWDGASWSATSRFVAAQDADSVVALTQVSVDGEWENSERSIYANTSIDTIVEAIEELERLLMGEDFASLFLAAFVLPDATHQEWQDGAWVDVMRQETNTWYDLFTGAVLRREITADQYDEEAEDWVAYRLVTSFEVLGNSSRPDSVFLQMEIAEDEFMTYLQQTLEYDELGNVTDVYTAMAAEDGEGFENYSWTHHSWIGVGSSAGSDDIAKTFKLDAAYPNPFNPSTRLNYEMKTSGHVAIRVYDLLGRRVATLFEGEQVAGSHEVRLDADGLGSGTYFVRMEAGGHQQTQSITLVK